MLVIRYIEKEPVCRVKDRKAQTERSRKGLTMGITVNAGKLPVFLRSRTGGSKSSEKKMERMQNRDDQIAVLEKQKANLKNRECTSVEEIEDKLGLLHSYEDQIRAVKHAFNMEEMSHILDEAREECEKIAEEIKKLLPETKEEREDALLEDALGGEDTEGMLSELLGEIEEEPAEEIPDASGEMPEVGAEHPKTKELSGAAAEMERLKELAGQAAEESAERAEEEAAELTKNFIAEKQSKETIKNPRL